MRLIFPYGFYDAGRIYGTKFQLFGEGIPHQNWTTFCMQLVHKQVAEALASVAALARSRVLAPCFTE